MGLAEEEVAVAVGFGGWGRSGCHSCSGSVAFRLKAVLETWA